MLSNVCLKLGVKSLTKLVNREIGDQSIFLLIIKTNSSVGFPGRKEGGIVV